MPMAALATCIKNELLRVGKDSHRSDTASFEAIMDPNGHEASDTHGCFKSSIVGDECTDHIMRTTRLSAHVFVQLGQVTHEAPSEHSSSLEEAARARQPLNLGSCSLSF